MCLRGRSELSIASVSLGDLSLKLHIHDTSLWGLEGHHQIEGLTSVHTHSVAHRHTRKTTLAHTLGSTAAPEGTASPLSRKF